MKIQNIKIQTRIQEQKAQLNYNKYNKTTQNTKKTTRNNIKMQNPPLQKNSKNIGIQQKPKTGYTKQIQQIKQIKIQ